MMNKLQEINKAMTGHFTRKMKIVNCWQADHLLQHDDNEAIKKMTAIRKRGNGVALLLIEKK